MPKSSPRQHEIRTTGVVGVILIAWVVTGFAGQPTASVASAPVPTETFASASQHDTVLQLRTDSLFPNRQLTPAAEFLALALAREPSASLSASDSTEAEPMTLVVSLNDQQINVYRGTELITSSKVSTGMPGYGTKPGLFSILEKQRYHHSNMYSGAPMPWMQRLTWSGTALHGGVVPNYPASHGCIRLPFSFAPNLFQITTLGDHVVVARDKIAPKLIEHPTLFQPLPPPFAPGVATKETVQQRPSDRPGESEGALPPAVTSEYPEHPATQALTGQAETAVSGPMDAPATAANTETNLARFQAVDRFARTFNNQTHKLSSKGHADVTAPSLAPLRILVTRRTERDQIISLQYILASMGYLAPQKFSGRLGQATVRAIKAFRKANGMRETGTFTDDLVKKVYEIAGEEEPPEGHLFVRQGFRPVFDVPIAFENPHRLLGTHVFTAMRFAPGDTKTHWMALSLEGDDATRVLDRIQIPNNVRQKISERLTAGSSLIIGDTSVNSAILPAGDDFVVWANDTPPVWETARDGRGYTVIRIYRGMDVEEIRVMRAPVAAGLIP